MISVDTSSPVAPYEQVRAQLADQISHGVLPIGTRLPTVRALAGDLGLAVNTVARAYHELELAGLVVTRGRAGTTVDSTDITRQHLHQAAARYAKLAHDAGLTTHEALDIVHTAIDPEVATRQHR